MKKLIVGFAGYAGAGKNTAAAALSPYGFTEASFAAPLKAGMLRLNPTVLVPSVVGTSGCTLELKPTKLRDLVARVGWEAAKRVPEVRQLLQRFGTEVGRELFGGDFWVNQLARRVRDKSFVSITDVRFPNEGEWVRKRGLLIWISRAGVGPINGHVSDNGACRGLAHVIIDNSGTTEELRQKVVEAVIYRHLKR